MVKNIKTKGVAFNLDDPDQKELLEYAMKRTNFSAYVKRLIQKDMDGIAFVSGGVVGWENEQEEMITDDILSSMI